MQKEKYLGNLEQERKESNEERLKATSNKYVILAHNSYTFQVFSFAWDKHSGASKAYMKSPTRMQLDSMQSVKNARSQHHSILDEFLAFLMYNYRAVISSQIRSQGHWQ